jgi:hypothetical protein
MSKDVGIYIRSVGRPQRIEPILENLKKTAPDAEVIFMAEFNDPIVAPNVIRGDFRNPQNAANATYWLNKHPFFHTAPDDWEWQPGWFDACMKVFNNPLTSVVSPKIFDGTHSNNNGFIVRRSYIQTQSGVVDMPNTVFYPYVHYYCDTEFLWTSKTRGVWNSCDDAVIYHNQVWDATHESVNNQNIIEVDKATYNSRRHLFRGP